MNRIYKSCHKSRQVIQSPVKFLHKTKLDKLQNPVFLFFQIVNENKIRNLLLYNFPNILIKNLINILIVLKTSSIIKKY